jgi:cyclic beta-1,2-glucan synthetase
MARALKPRAPAHALLDPALGPTDPPLREPVPVTASAHERGVRLAGLLGREVRAATAASFLPRLKASTRALQRAHRSLAQQARGGHALSEAGIWLLDNIGLISEQISAVRDGLPRGFYRRLPVFDGGTADGLPRVFALAWAHVGDTDSRFDVSTLSDFLEGWQADPAQELTLAELWALPTTLRLVLIENLRRLAERTAAEEAAREEADRLCDGPVGSGVAGADAPAAALTVDTLQDVFARMARRGVGDVFALQVMHRLHDEGDTLPPLARDSREPVRAALAAALPDPDAAARRQHQERAADDASVAQALRSLQALARADWRALVSASSRLVQMLQLLPVFAAESDATQDLGLHGVEELAWQAGWPESAVAHELAERMRQAGRQAARHASPGTAAPAEAAGHWLSGSGRAELRAALGLAPHPRWLQWARAHALALYLLVLGLVSVALVWVLLARAPGAPGLGAGALALIGLLALAPASDVVAALLHRLLGEWTPPRHAPRLALAEGIPAAERVLVVVPAMLADDAGIAALVAQLERHHLASREPQAQYALLSDYTDAEAEALPGDAALLAAAQRAIDVLELRHAAEPMDGSTEARRFLLLHRPRRWSLSEQRWIGWERKRGKLEQLISWLALPESESPFIDLGTIARPRPATRHVLTLDSDTQLPAGVLRALVGVAAHPLNRPRIDPLTRRVIAGHAILQPRLDLAAPALAEHTPYHRMLAGPLGHDPYNTASSDVFGDLFDEAAYTGKGLLDVAALHAVLGGRLPEGQVLSHDLLEGTLARCGRVGDVVLAEPAPSHPDVAAARGHRWIRGDWQLLPLLLQPRRHGLSALGFWKMADNLRRSLVAPLALLLLALSMLGTGLPPLTALGLALAAFGTGPVLAALAGLAPSRDDLAWHHFVGRAGSELGRALLVTAWQLAMWPRQAASQTSAIGLALWRSFVSRRHLLQWTRADMLVAAPPGWRQALAPAGAALAWAAAMALDTPAPALATALALLWAAQPLWVALAGRAPAVGASPLSADDRRYLLGVARDTWRFFELHVGASTNHLPPDNVQAVPRQWVAARTSPTNIGLYLLSVASARAFGWLSVDEMLARLEATLATLQRLPRYRGHVLNWIDTGTLQALTPAYVSVVDSGNLCVHLLATAAALDEAAWPQPTRWQPCPAWPSEEQRQGLARAAARCRELAAEPEFGFLFDPRRRLFHIGWRVADQLADEGHYDLLASEARAASLWAIAKGDVPVTHWAALGRPLQAAGREVGLRSWSGSMFEYLMPALVFEEPVDSLLGRAARMAVVEQQRHGRRLGLPWGQSECARAEVDASMAYQYGPQGVPRLAMRRTPPEERVIAPYATVLAAMVDPAASVANLRRLEALGARGREGFVEALDDSPERRGSDGSAMLVQTGMAHHQGMVLVALAVVLLRGRPRRWGMAEPAIAAVAALLQERVPHEVLPVPDREGDLPAVTRADPPAAQGDWIDPRRQALPPTLLLSNGHHAVALRPGGAGFSRCGDVDLSRRRDDLLRDAHGHFLWLRRTATAAPVSLTLHPGGDDAALYRTRFCAAEAVFMATWPELRSRCTVWVEPDRDVELRRIELWNTSPQALSVELMSAFEPCLSPARADEMHPGFANLFIETRWDAEAQALWFTRRPRRDDEATWHAVHLVLGAEGASAPARPQADRARWRGRRRGAAEPLAEFDATPTPSGALATGLDPVAALSQALVLPPHGTAQWLLATAAGTDLPQLQALVASLRADGPVAAEEPPAVPPGTERLQHLATVLLMTSTRAPSAGRPCNRHAFWRLGLSGERPIVQVRIAQSRGLPLLRLLLRGLQVWAQGGLVVDLVVVNHEPRSYAMPLHHALMAMREQQRHEAAEAHTPAGAGELHVWLASELAPAELAGLAQLARVRLRAEGQPLAEQLDDWLAAHQDAHDQARAVPSVRLDRAAATAPARPRSPPVEFDGSDGSCRFATSPARPTPRPWVNVLANAEFGSLVSEAGRGFSWAGNSRLNQLTAWGNDELADMDGERFVVQDRRSGRCWTVGLDDTGDGCRVSHAPGQTTISQTLRLAPAARGGRHAHDARDSRDTRLAHDRHDSIALQAHWCVDAGTSVKRVRLQLQHRGPGDALLRVVGLVEWLLGCLRGDRASIATAWAEGSGAGPDLLLATQLDGQGGRGGHTAFLMLHRTGAEAPALVDWTCDRRELYGADGRAQLPQHLLQRAGAGLDPCAAVAMPLRLAAGGAAELVFTLGHAESAEAARALAAAAWSQDAAAAEQAARAHWQALGSAVQVSSPDPLFDALVNHWLPYQVLACRLWARAGFHQVGGAYGFRDQLQDTMALVLHAPALLPAQLHRAAARQFVEGDVQHWWHPDTGAGPRTRFSDDRLWLPHALLHQVRSSGSTALLDECEPFLHGEELAPGAEDSYQVLQPRGAPATLYEHGARAIDRSLASGAHGLPLMGGGDWNDGMNRIGPEGRGESVWLAWFLCDLVRGYAPLAQARGDTARATLWRQAARGWQQALAEQGWDGAWYRRAFFDDGTPLGTAAAAECRIDLVAQAWSVLSAAGPSGARHDELSNQREARARQAMASAARELGDEPLGLLRLLHPPLADARPRAGYIQAYPPGVRENGGQYSHAGAWAVLAFARLGEPARAWQAWQGLSPAHRAAHPVQGPLYGLEPYVMAADVYSAPPYAGRGGWSWYTGSAGVMLRAALEGLCGLQVEGTRLRLQPQLPPAWPGVTLRVVVAGRPWLLQIWRADAVQELRRARARGATALKRGRWFETAAASAGHELLLVLPAPRMYGPVRTAPVPTPRMGRFEPTLSAEPETR